MYNSVVIVNYYSDLLKINHFNLFIEMKLNFRMSTYFKLVVKANL